MTEMNLSLVQKEILKGILAAGGKIKIDVLIQSLRIHFPDVSYDVLIKDVDKDINELWKRDLISIPGLRWLAIPPEDIQGFLSNEGFMQTTVLLTEEGKELL